MLGELSRVQSERVLLSEAVGRIGCYGDGRVYVVPVSYVYDGERVICHSVDGRKIQMMRANPEVCFEVEQLQDLQNWRSVICWGRFEELGGNAAASGLSLLVDRLMPLMRPSPSPGAHSVTPHGHQPGAEPIIYSIRLREMTGRFERS